jgi:class 3 adenylate cyclase/tetratricopeptide (TPR) repeat protein
MKCPKCQFDNRDGVKFCEECRTEMGLECPKCGTKIPLRRKFCGGCGHALSEPKEPSPIDYTQPHSYTPKHLVDKILTTRSSIKGERKLVTVMFADVADFTSLSEKLDPEEVHQIMDGCFEILMDEIHKYEGTINQFTGDGVMALFGAPVAHEDHAQRACHAALSIQEHVSSYGEKVRKESSVNFKMRIGVNSGPVVVGSIGDDLRIDYTAVGDTTNLASRMESMARPGAVLIADPTRRLVEDFFQLRPLGRMAVKGKSEPQEVFELIGTGDAATRMQASIARGLTKFIGRKNSMSALMDAYDKAKEGSGQAVGIVGEAGVGKSRLLLEFRNRLAQDESTYLEGRCLHYGGAMPYLPILDILRSYFEIKEEDRESVIRKKLEERIIQLNENLKRDLPSFQDLLSLKAEDAEYLALEPKEKKERAFEAIRNLLIRESQRKTVIVAIEDLHWIDKTSEAFLNYLIGSLANARVLLILLYRPEYTHPWASKSCYNHIGLDQLSMKSSAELVQEILEGGEVVPELRELILNRAAGNPLFMEELTHTLLENGSIERKERQFVLTRQPSDIQVPDTIQGIIAARIDRLDEGLKRIMQVASVIGREFAFRILHAIMEIKEGLKSHLVNLQGLEFIYEKSLFPELEYIFKHALTQEVAYNSLLLKKRRDIHGKIGEAIEAIHSDRLEEFYEMLAYHYSNSDHLEKAIQYLNLAGDKAMRRYSPLEAFHFYRDALSGLKQMPETNQNKKERIGVILSMAFAVRLMAFPENSFELLQEGESLCSDLEDKRSWALIHSYSGMFYSSRGDAPLGMKFQQDAFEAAEKLQDSEIMIQIGANLCFSYDFAGEYRKIVQAAPKVVALLEKTPKKFEFFDTPVDLYPVLIALYGHALGYVGEFAQAEKECERALILAQQGGNPYSLGWVEFMYGCQYLPKGDGRNAVKHLHNSTGYFEKVGALAVLQVAWSLLASGYSLLGESDNALEYFRKMHEVQTDIESPGFLSLGHLASSSAYLNSGNLDEAKVHAEKALNLGQTHHERYCEGSS